MNSLARAGLANFSLKASTTRASPAQTRRAKMARAAVSCGGATAPYRSRLGGSTTRNSAIPSRSMASSMATGPASSAASGPSSSVTSPAGRSQAPVMNHTPSSPSAKAIAAPPGTSCRDRFGARYAFRTASDSNDTPRWIPSSRGIHGASRPSGSRNGSSGRGIRPPTTCQTSATNATAPIRASDTAPSVKPQSAPNTPGSSTNHFSCASGSDSTHAPPGLIWSQRASPQSGRHNQEGWKGRWVLNRRPSAPPELGVPRAAGRGRLPESRRLGLPRRLGLAWRLAVAGGRERPQHGQRPFAQPAQRLPAGHPRSRQGPQLADQVAQRPHLLLDSVHRVEVGHQRLHPHPNQPQPPPQVAPGNPSHLGAGPPCRARGPSQPGERAIALEQGGDLGGAAAEGGEVGAAKGLGGEPGTTPTRTARAARAADAAREVAQAGVELVDGAAGPSDPAGGRPGGLEATGGHAGHGHGRGGQPGPLEHRPPGGCLHRLQDLVDDPALVHHLHVGGHEGGEAAQHPEPQRGLDDAPLQLPVGRRVGGVAVLQVPQVGPGPGGGEGGRPAAGRGHGLRARPAG